MGKAGETDTDAFNIYTRAEEYFHDWRSSGVLRQDEEPSVYLYSQTFTIPGLRDVAERRCLIVRGRIYDYENNVVFPSEHTLSRPKLDRLNLLRATKANFGQILMLYSDPAGTIQSLLRKKPKASRTNLSWMNMKCFTGCGRSAIQLSSPPYNSRYATKSS